MSEPENFLDRWSRRKRETVDESAPVPSKDVAATPPPSGESKEPSAEVPFDPASLPSIESIAAQSDIRAFLKPGTPPELTRAALRRAWSADPAIRDFIGLVENGWDFNDPNGIPGFGPLPVGDVAQLLARVIGAPSEATSEPPVKPQQVAAGSSEQNPPQTIDDSDQPPQLPQDQPASGQEFAAPKNELVQRSENAAASQNKSDDGEERLPSRQRGHGGALPK